MMKIYKHTYLLTLLYVLCSAWVIAPAIMLAFDIYATVQGALPFGKICLLSLGVGLICTAISIAFFLLCNGILRLFPGKTVKLSENQVEYEGKKLFLRDIRYITFHLPQMEKHSSEPSVLMLWADATHYIYIKRPSIRLMYQLKRCCPSAKFEVEDWLGELKRNLIISGILAVALPLLVHFAILAE